MTASYVDALRKISIRCTDFLSYGVPLYKQIPWSVGGTFARVKVRFRKPPEFCDTLNALVGADIADRYVEANTVLQESVASSRYYMFPSNGFKLAWTPSCVNIPAALNENVQLPTIRTGDLELAAAARRDVLLYDISDYYVIHVEACVDFATLVEGITSSTVAPTQLRGLL